MVPYVSPELTAKLRSQQQAIRQAMQELRRDAPEVPVGELPGRLEALEGLHQSYNALVNALMDAVEPDNFVRRDDI